MEEDIFDTFHAFDGMSPQDFQGHHNSILEYLSVVLEMEDMNGGVIGAWSHERILLVEVDGRDGLLMELHGLIGSGWEIDIVAD